MSHLYQHHMQQNYLAIMYTEQKKLRWISHFIATFKMYSEVVDNGLLLMTGELA